MAKDDNLRKVLRAMKKKVGFLVEGNEITYTDSDGTERHVVITRAMLKEYKK